MLDLEPGDDSSLVTGDVGVVQPEDEPTAEVPIMLGGATVPVQIEADDGGDDHGRHAMTAAEDRRSTTEI